jgi:glycosyltransferase involved in cell wall biosynthesis
VSAEATRLLLAAYPVPEAVRLQVEGACGVRFAEVRSLGELKRLGPLGILKALRRIRVDELWLLVSDHNFQPLLPLLLLVSAATAARRLRVSDFAGTSYAVSRLSIFVREPARLAFWTVRGFLALVATDREARKLLAAPRCSPSSIPEKPGVAYLKTNLWFGVQAGGSVGHVAGIVNGFFRTGCPVDVYAAEGLPMIDPAIPVLLIRGDGATGVPLELGKLVFQDAFLEQARRSLSRRPVNLLYQRYCLYNHTGVSLSRELGIPLVVEYNGSEVWAAEHWGVPLAFPGVARRLEEANLRHADLIVVVSQVLKQELRQQGIPEERILFYPNCVDPRAFDPARFSEEDIAALRGRWGIPRDALVCTFLGTFGPWHGVGELAEVVKRLAETAADWLRPRGVHFLFVGDGQLMPRVKETLREVPPEFYTLVGLVPQAEAPLYLAASDLLLSPHVGNPDGSRFFGSPTKLFEYMAMGRAIVASELEQIGEVLAGSHHVGRDGMPPSEESLARSLGLLVTPGAMGELIEAIRFLAESPEARMRVGGAARARALERYTWDRHVGAILERLRALGRRPSGGSALAASSPGLPKSQGEHRDKQAEVGR